MGVGNDILMDDGIGPRLAREIGSAIINENIAYDTACLGGLEIIEYISGYKKVIFIDAIKTQGGIAGTVYYFTPADFRETLHLSNLHDVSFLTALELARQLDNPVPEKIHIIAIEIIEDMTFGEEFTPPLAKRYSGIVAEVSVMIEEIINEG